MRKVIFHVDEIEKWAMTLTNLENLVSGLERTESIIRVLANGPAVKTYHDGEQETKNRIQVLKNQGVLFSACQNALNNFDIKNNEILDFVEVVPAGVIELIDRQAEGYAYIRP